MTLIVIFFVFALKELKSIFPGPKEDLKMQGGGGKYIVV